MNESQEQLLVGRNTSLRKLRLCASKNHSIVMGRSTYLWVRRGDVSRSLTRMEQLNRNFPLVKEKTRRIFAKADDPRLPRCDEISVRAVCVIDIVVVVVVVVVVVAKKYEILVQNDSEGVKNRLINKSLISLLSRTPSVDVAIAVNIPCVKCQANKEASTRLALMIVESFEQNNGWRREFAKKSQRTRLETRARRRPAALTCLREMGYTP